MPLQETINIESLRHMLHLLDLDRVFPHEETIPALADNLAKEISNDGVLLDPIVLDEKTSVVLDGMHRVEALRLLGAKRVLAFSIDYPDEAVKVYRWLRCLRQISTELLADLMAELSLTPAEVSSSRSQVDDGRTALALMTPSDTYISAQRFSSLADSYRLVRRFDKRVSEKGISFETNSETQAFQQLGSKYVAVLYTQPIEKKDVLASALHRHLFPAKCTRHVIPIRPVGIKYPLSDLVSSSNDAQKQLQKIVKSSTPIVLNQGSYYRGRKYDEKLVVFRR